MAGNLGNTGSPDNAVRRSACRLLCRYYKPHKLEDPACGAYELLLAGGRGERYEALISGLDPFGAPLYGVDREDERLLAVCAKCTYPVEDECDFRNPAVPDDECAPCGALRAVAGLLACGQDPLSGN